MKIFLVISGVLVTILGLVMMFFTWAYFFERPEEIIQLASLYVSLFISVFVFALGMIAIVYKIKK